MSILRNFASLAASVGLAIGLLSSGPALAGDENGNFMIRLQGTAVITQDKLKSLNHSTIGDLKALGFDAEVSNEIVPTATLTYFLNRNWSLELLCCFAKHSIDLKPGPGFANLAGEVANMWIFPPAVTLQYHFTGMGALKPYVGAGVQYIHFFNEKTGANPIGASSVNVSDAFGPILQAGIDVSLGSGWYLNADVKKSWLDTKVTWQNALGGTIVAKDNIDPLIISVGLGYRFDLGRGHIEPLK